ncbi:hypothetical protein BDW02DRAFT_81923 [Decorospora gaudefroyi]|uniref:Uncharacterized protein n=1 Tax=Decorospora gaudefroyi TaxID=184978 RepID=A0A6A5KRG1_9PLEO|nr:hypothetical protein BDW02DRAFT_81923 [Decorospora gaudefroyi]
MSLSWSLVHPMEVYTRGNVLVDMALDPSKAFLIHGRVHEWSLLKILLVQIGFARIINGVDAARSWELYNLQVCGFSYFSCPTVELWPTPFLIPWSMVKPVTLAVRSERYPYDSEKTVYGFRMLRKDSPMSRRDVSESFADCKVAPCGSLRYEPISSGVHDCLHLNGVVGQAS